MVLNKKRVTFFYFPALQHGLKKAMGSAKHNKLQEQ